MQEDEEPRRQSEEATDRWFEFVEEYYKKSTVPLSYVLLPQAVENQSFRTMGSPIGCLKLSKREYNNLMNRKEEKCDT